MIKVLVTSVEDLTVARYFAAMNVEYLSFDYSFEKTQKIKEIIDWVDGPKLILQVPYNISQEEHDIVCHTLCPHFVITDESVVCDCLVPVVSYNKIDILEEQEDNVIIKLNDSLESLKEEELEKLKTLAKMENVFIEINTYSDWDLNFIKSNRINIVLKAGSEDKTGIKSFDEFDRIFEFINEED